MWRLRVFFCQRLKQNENSIYNQCLQKGGFSFVSKYIFKYCFFVFARYLSMSLALVCAWYPIGTHSVALGDAVFIVVVDVFIAVDVSFIVAILFVVVVVFVFSPQEAPHCGFNSPNLSRFSLQTTPRKLHCARARDLTPVKVDASLFVKEAEATASSTGPSFTLKE